MWKLFLLFTVVPAIELYLLVMIGQNIGALETVWLVLMTGAVGAWLAKREGFGLLRQLSAELGQGVPPADRLVEGLMVIVGGVLLITPGVITDLVGILMILPFTRTRLARVARTWLVRSFTGPGGGVSFRSSNFFFRMGGDGAAQGPSPEPSAPQPPPARPRGFDHPSA